MTAADAELGAMAHALLADAVHETVLNGARPTPEDVFVSAGKALAAHPLPGAARQRLACLVNVGLSLVPPWGWKFLGSEVAYEGSRVDLAWSHPDGRVIFDEVKVAGYSKVMSDPATVDQVRRHLSAGAAAYGERFCGVRLLNLSGPSRSLFFSGPNRPVRLVQTPWWFHNERR